MNKKTIIVLILALLAVLIGYRYFSRKSVPYFPRINYSHYPAVKDSINHIRRQLCKSNASAARLKRSFINVMENDLFPYWYGTRWSFNGTTETPQTGSIACGYFVTTTLRDAGFPLQRVKLAQCASEEMIKKLVQRKFIHRYSSISLQAFNQHLNEHGKGLYLIGLDNHTGFILCNNQGNFFIHSCGVFPYKVIREKVLESGVLKRSAYRVIGKISDDELALKKWAGIK